MNNKSQIKILALLIVSIFALGAVYVCTDEAYAADTTEDEFLSALQGKIDVLNEAEGINVVMDDDGNITVEFDDDIEITFVREKAEAFVTSLKDIAGDDSTLVIKDETFTLSEADVVGRLAGVLLGDTFPEDFLINGETISANYTANVFYEDAEITLNGNVSFKVIGTEERLIEALQEKIDVLNEAEGINVVMDNDENITVEFDDNINPVYVKEEAVTFVNSLREIAGIGSTLKIDGNDKEFTLDTVDVGELAGVLLGDTSPEDFLINGETISANYTANVDYKNTSIGLNGNVSFKVLKTITWNWADADGDQTATTKVAYGTPAAEVTPPTEFESSYQTTEKVFTFSGWTPAVAEVTGDAEYTATYDETARTYTIKWMDGAKVFASDELEYNAEIIAPTEKPGQKYGKATVQTFTGWAGYTTEPVMKVTDDRDFNAIFSSVARTYTINWMNGDTIFTSYNLVYDADITAPAGTPKKASTAQTDYEFSGWQGYSEGMKVDRNIEFKAVFDEVIITHDDISHDDILDEISNNEKPVLRLKDATGTIDNTVFEGLGDDKPLTIHVMKGDSVAYSWTFTGSSNDNPGTFSPSIDTVSDDDIDEGLNNAIGSTKIKNSLVLSFAASGNLPKNASVSYDVGDKYADGTELSLFYYDEGKLVDQGQTVTVIDGVVTFDLTHASSYVLAETSPDTTVVVDDDDTMVFVAIALSVAIVVIAALVAVVAVRSKNKA